MAVAAVLRSQDCLGGRFRDESLTLTASRHRRKSPSPMPSPNPNPSPNESRSRRRKRSPGGFRSRLSEAVVEKFPAISLVMEEVKILKRGEALNREIFSGEVGDRKPGPKKRAEESEDFKLGSVMRLGPEPETVNKQVRVRNREASPSAAAAEIGGVYAGTAAFFLSPPPSSVPVPAFLGKILAATSRLGCILQLDLATEV